MLNVKRKRKKYRCRSYTTQIFVGKGKRRDKRNGREDWEINI